MQSSRASHLFRARRFDGQYIAHDPSHAATVLMGTTYHGNFCLFVCLCMRVSVHVRAGTRAIELDRACAGTEPLRMRSQRFHSFVSLSGVLFYVIICLARMLFM